MKSNEKRMILIFLIILVIAIIAFAVNNKNEYVQNENKMQESNMAEEFVQVLDNDTKLNTSTKLNEVKEINGLKFENIQLTQQNGQTVLLADVTNNTEKATEFVLVDITLLDKKGNEIVTVGGMISPLKIGEKTQFNTSMTLDYANAYDFKIVIK